MRTKNKEYRSNSSLKFEADASVRQTISSPVHGIKTQNIPFGRVSHDIIHAQTKQQQFLTEWFPVRITHIYPVVQRLTLFTKIVHRQRLIIFIQEPDFSGTQHPSNRERRTSRQLIRQSSSQLMRYIVQRGQLPFFRQFTKPLPASRVSIRQLQAPTLPVLIQISLYPITVSISYHQVFLPALIFNPRVRAQGQHIPSCLIVHRDFTLSRIHKMFPTHLIMLGRARLETVNAGHSEICG